MERAPGSNATQSGIATHLAQQGSPQVTKASGETSVVMAENLAHPLVVRTGI